MAALPYTYSHLREFMPNVSCFGFKIAVNLTPFFFFYFEIVTLRPKEKGNKGLKKEKGKSSQGGRRTQKRNKMVQI